MPRKGHSVTHVFGILCYLCPQEDSGRDSAVATIGGGNDRRHSLGRTPRLPGAFPRVRRRERHPPRRPRCRRRRRLSSRLRLLLDFRQSLPSRACSSSADPPPTRFATTRLRRGLCSNQVAHSRFSTGRWASSTSAPMLKSTAASPSRFTADGRWDAVGTLNGDLIGRPVWPDHGAFGFRERCLPTLSIRKSREIGRSDSCEFPSFSESGSRRLRAE